jgi:hypothetical protein
MERLGAFYRENMKTSYREPKGLARSLLAYEAAAGQTSELNESAAVRVCEKLRVPLCALAGIVGYRSLLARALTLARAKAPTSLCALRVTADGYLQGLGEPESQSDQHQVSEGDLLLTTHLLGLFLSLLGASVTLQLVRDAFPNLTVTTESGTLTPFGDILKEVGHLNSVSDRLELLADQHPSVEDVLMSVSGNVRNTATVLEVIALIRTQSDEPEKEAPKRERERYLM